MAKRFRFSIRTLAIFVTLVCAYFGLWEVTKRGVRDQYLGSAPAPFIIGHFEVDFPDNPNPAIRYKYYLWLFGYEIRLPIESKIKP